ncbi:MAG: SNF2-related protein [Akkermansiaceae bacterium]|nr:SNF2-related protein [Akkermansiaceae bacterium]
MTAKPGQRWISSSEPALGLGHVLDVEGDRVEIYFDVADEKRIYAMDSAPLVRVRLEVGDDWDGGEEGRKVVERVEEQDGLLVYHGDGWSLSEEELPSSLNFVRPEKRLLAGICDPPRDHDLRLKTLEWNSRIRQSAARGFMGARIELIPHQLAIALEASGRLQPRLMLADEVGLGKTIEACLILHHLLLTGRANRFLILVPEPLIHQWFVELLRRFNMTVAIFDEGRCQSIENGDPAANPFLDSQWVLASTDFLAHDAVRVHQAEEAGFDLLIVDEAHHLDWSPEKASEAYAMVEQLAARIPSLLLLTATPQQLGPEGHFARLRLLDPKRYHDLEQYRRECEGHVKLAAALDGLLEGKMPEGLEEACRDSPSAEALRQQLKGGDESAREALASELIDSFGTGRVLFRNTRDQLAGFPEREAHLHPLEPGESALKWLADWLQGQPEDEKVLLITGSPEMAIQVQEGLLEHVQVDTALFHEDLNLLQRDRNAAWFADPEGARILICSEIGSEGRNFQFARHLVLFGLPRNPELLEQRIGRLDRIGQIGTIHIHVPYGVASRSELQARWLHEGLDAFRKPLKGANALATTLLPELDELDESDSKAIEAFLERSRQLAADVADELAHGHDRLLELGSPKPERAAELVDQILDADEDRRFERFVLRLFDHLGLDVSDLAPRTFHLGRGQRHSEAFADLPQDGISVTFDREHALAREDVGFMTADHPMLLGAIDQLASSERGNASFAVWKRRGGGKAIWLEVSYVLEALAPSRLQPDRFLPPTLLRICVDHQGKLHKPQWSRRDLEPGDPRKLVGQEVFRAKLMPTMLDAAKEAAGIQSSKLIEEAKEAASEHLNAEIQRLQDLAHRNPQVSPEEVEALQDHADELIQALDSSRIRLDALRLVWAS